MLKIISAILFGKHHFAVYKGQNLVVYYDNKKLIPSNYNNDPQYTVKRLIEL